MSFSGSITKQPGVSEVGSNNNNIDTSIGFYNPNYDPSKGKGLKKHSFTILTILMLFLFIMICYMLYNGRCYVDKWKIWNSNTRS